MTAIPVAAITCSVCAPLSAQVFGEKLTGFQFLETIATLPDEVLPSISHETRGIRLKRFVTDRFRMAHKLEFDEVPISRQQIHGLGGCNVTGYRYDEVESRCQASWLTFCQVIRASCLYQT